jgi:hypothetical protein
VHLIQACRMRGECGKRVWGDGECVVVEGQVLESRGTRGGHEGDIPTPP